MSKESHRNAARTSRPFKVDRQRFTNPLRPVLPQTLAAIFKVIDFPMEDGPTKWKPPLSSPVDFNNVEANADDTAKTRREFPSQYLPTCFCQSASEPDAPKAESMAAP